MPYTTQELLDILDQELKATWRGERLLLSSESRLNHPVVSKALGAHKLSKVFAIQDFRAQIHAYQHQHQVSGLISHHCTFKGQTIEFPELHPQLIAIPDDKIRLAAAKPVILAFWQNAIDGLQLWRAGHDPEPVTINELQASLQRAEWAEISATRSELFLSLCWGNPKECYCDWAYPESGCERIIAAVAEPSAIKV